MRFITAQPANNYFLWQLQVFDYQFEKLGYNLNDSKHILVTSGELTPALIDYYEKNKDRVILVPDNREDKSYLPNIQIQGLYQAFKKYPELSLEPFFLHDSDIVFTKYIDWDSLMQDDKTVYCSDTISYIGAKYIDSKSPELTDRMAEVVGVSPFLVRKNQEKSGGAQYIFPSGITASYWSKVEKDGTVLYRLMQSTSKQYHPEAPIQSWTASMWSILWNLWYHNYDTIVHPDMEFAWSNWHKDKWDTVNIYHNAGVVNATQGNFFKGMYINIPPFGQNFDYVTKKDTCNYKYLEIIMELGEKLK